MRVTRLANVLCSYPVCGNNAFNILKLCISCQVLICPNYNIHKYHVEELRLLVTWAPRCCTFTSDDSHFYFPYVLIYFSIIFFYYLSPCQI